jgi:hypothetical protein
MAHTDKAIHDWKEVDWEEVSRIATDLWDTGCESSGGDAWQTTLAAIICAVLLIKHNTEGDQRALCFFNVVKLLAANCDITPGDLTKATFETTGLLN